MTASGQILVAAHRRCPWPALTGTSRSAHMRRSFTGWWGGRRRSGFKVVAQTLARVESGEVDEVCDAGRRSFERRAWRDAYVELSAADRLRRWVSTIWSAWPWRRTSPARTTSGRRRASEPITSACARMMRGGRPGARSGSASACSCAGEMAPAGGWLAPCRAPARRRRSRLRGARLAAPSGGARAPVRRATLAAPSPSSPTRWRSVCAAATPI